MEALQIINQLPATKAEMETFVKSAVNDLLDGTRDILEVNIKLKVMEDIIKAIRDNSDVRFAIMDEASKYEKSFEYLGAKITQTRRTTFSFDYDPVWKQIQEDIEKGKKMQKMREESLKVGVDPSTGEVLQKPTSKTTEYLTITFK